MRVHEEGHGNGAWSPPVFWFTLKGVKNVGNCSTWSGSDTTLFVANSEMFYSMILAAQAQGGEIAVAWDDTKTRNGWCRALFITSGNPPTLN